MLNKQLAALFFRLAVVIFISSLVNLLPALIVLEALTYST